MAEGLTAFRWVASDCATAAAAHVLAVSGVDVSERFAGAYHDARTARRLISEAGGFAALVDRVLDGVWVRGGRELALLGVTGREVLAVRREIFWLAPGDGGPLWVHADAVDPLATWGPV
jgi:hypothetical protein